MRKVNWNIELIKLPFLVLGIFYDILVVGALSFVDIPLASILQLGLHEAFDLLFAVEPPNVLYVPPKRLNLLVTVLEVVGFEPGGSFGGNC